MNVCCVLFLMRQNRTSCLIFSVKQFKLVYMVETRKLTKLSKIMLLVVGVSFTVLYKWNWKTALLHVHNHLKVMWCYCLYAYYDVGGQGCSVLMKVLASLVLRQLDCWICHKAIDPVVLRHLDMENIDDFKLFFLSYVMLVFVFKINHFGCSKMY